MSLQLKGTEWHLSPIGRRRGELKLWQSYSREEIPALFDLDFSTAIWNVGFVKRPGHVFLLVTLDKSGHAEGFHYHDRFLARTEFQGQSQNRTTQDSPAGQDIKNHAERNIGVHLFVRTQKKRAGGGSAPFIYCGDVRFQSWKGDKPITVQWQLPAPVPDAIWKALAERE